MKSGSTERLPKLDFLRAVSVSLVIAYHAGHDAVPAGFGVLTFFVISGFLITYLLVKEQQRTGTVSLKQFYIRRSLRIFPAFYVFWLLIVGAALLLRPSVLIPGQVAAAFFYVNNYYQGTHAYPSSLMSHTWSLGVEEQFYLLWPAVFLVFRSKLQTLVKGLCVFIPLLWAYRIFLVKLGVSDPYLYTSFETRVDAILVGCLLAIVLATGSAPRLVNELRKLRYMPVVIALLALSVFVGFRTIENYKYLVGYAVEPVLVGVLILQLTSFKGAEWLDRGPVSYLGRISYSSYLYQGVVITMLHSRLPSGLAIIGCFVGVWIVAALSFELIEKPFLRLRKRFEVVKVPEPGVQAVA